MGFNSTWRGLIQEYLRSTSFSVLMNGTLSGFSTPSRGHRQGDPLSPLLFVLCTEGFPALLQQAISDGKLEGVKVASPLVPPLGIVFGAYEWYPFRVLHLVSWSSAGGLSVLTPLCVLH
ncbi:unnamed protein product [Linum trigynum]|uniref:Reverse transcriptase domain-containing protein n=1 Tax=Linum trigynum TaxID=586398 RepID=A0AAV2GZS7_9ROSI